MTLRKLDLTGGTGGTGGSYSYIAPNGIKVTSTDPTYTNNSYYHMSYLFNNTKSPTDYVYSYWLTSGSKNPTYLTFDMGEDYYKYDISEIRVWPRTRGDSLTHYSIEVSDDNINYTEIVPTFTNDYAYPFDKMNVHNVKVHHRYIRFVLRYTGSWGVSLSEIEFWYKDYYFLIEDGTDLKSYQDVPIKEGNLVGFTGAVTSYMKTNNLTPMPTDAITIEQWVAPTSIATYPTTFSFASVANPTDAITFYRVTNSFRFYINGAILSTNISIPTYEYTHIAISWRASDGYVCIYLNGEIVKEAYYVSTSLLPSVGCVTLGQDQNALGGGFAASGGFVGEIGETIVWNRVLRPEEVKAHANNIISEEEEGLHLWWDFSEGTGATLTDKIQGAVLTMNNASWVNGKTLKSQKEIVIVGTTPPTDELFLDAGFFSSKEIMPSDIEHDTARLLAFSEKAKKAPIIEETALPYPQIVYPQNDIDITIVSEINWLRLSTLIVGRSDIRVILSFDEGASWLYYDDVTVPGQWKVVSNEKASVEEVAATSMSVSTFNAISSDNWNEVRGEANTIRVAYLLSSTSTDELAHIDDLMMFVKNYGKWKHYKEAQWKYSEEELKVSLYKNGDFKINYYK